MLIASAQCLNRWLHFNMTAMCLSKECHPTVQLSEWAHTQCCRVPPKSTKFKYLSYYNWHAWEHKKWHNWTAGILFFKIITCSFSWILFFSLNTLRYKIKDETWLKRESLYNCLPQRQQEELQRNFLYQILTGTEHLSRFLLKQLHNQIPQLH